MLGSPETYLTLDGKQAREFRPDLGFKGGFSWRRATRAPALNWYSNMKRQDTMHLDVEDYCLVYPDCNYSSATSCPEMQLGGWTEIRRTHIWRDVHSSSFAKRGIHHN